MSNTNRFSKRFPLTSIMEIFKRKGPRLTLGEIIFAWPFTVQKSLIFRLRGLKSAFVWLLVSWSLDVCGLDEAAERGVIRIRNRPSRWVILNNTLTPQLPCPIHTAGVSSQQRPTNHRRLGWVSAGWSSPCGGGLLANQGRGYLLPATHRGL